MGLNDFSPKKDKGTKAKAVKPVTEKEYHNILIPVEAIELIDRIALFGKLKDRSFTKGQAILDAMRLLAKKRDITLD